MKSITERTGRVKRINLTLSNSMFTQLEAITKENNMKYVDAIRESISEWIKVKRGEFMTEGYKARAEENLAMLEEFKHRDREVW